MSSQKYGRLVMEETGAYIWHCKLLKEECSVTSFSTAKPMCDKCPIAKEHKANVKLGKQIAKSFMEKKEVNRNKYKAFNEKADGEFVTEGEEPDPDNGV